MTFFKELKQNVVNSLEDATKLAALKAEDVAENLKHEARQDAMANKVDELKDDYQQIKTTFKDTLQ